MNSDARYIFILPWVFLLCIVPSCFAQDKKDERMQQLVFESLIHFHYCKVLRCEAGNPYPSSIPSSTKWYSEESKKELMILLENKWPNGEKENLAEKSVRSHLETEILNLTRSKENIELSSRHKKSLQKRLDSLTRISQINPDTFPPYQQAVQKRVKELDELKVDDQLIRIAGLLDDPRYIPILKKAIGDSVHYEQHMVKLALARFRVEPYHSDMVKYYGFDASTVNKKKKNHRELNSYYNSKRSGLLYISTQESILELSKFLPVELRVTDSRALNSDDVGYSPVSRRAFEDIAGRLNNKEIIDYVSVNSNELNVNPTEFRMPQEAPINKRHITFLQKWIKENYDQYQIIRDKD